MKRKRGLAERYPASEPCSCEVCLRYCLRPGWWTVAEAAAAIEAGYGPRMMLELSPDRSVGVVSPAFAGNEGKFALQRCAPRGCNFLSDGRCELHGTPFQPLECRYCHHDRVGRGQQCHDAIEADWKTPAGRALVERWGFAAGLW